MPGADASIYSMVRPPERQQGPLDQFGTVLALRNMVDSGELNALQRTKLKGDLAEEDAFKSKIADWVRSGGQGNLSPDAWAASPSRAQAFEKQRLESQKSAEELRKTQLENIKTRATGMRDIFAKVNSDADIPWAKEQIVKLEGADVAANIFAKDPFFQGPFSIEKKAAAVQTGDKMVEQLTPKYEKVDTGGKVQMVDINPTTNPAVKGMVFNKTPTPGEVQQANAPVWDEARGVYVMKPGATAAPAGAPGASPAAAPAAAPGAAPGVVRPAGLPPKPTDVHNLRNEFNGLPEVKGYRDIVPVVESARSAPNTRAGDIQLGYAVGKILDPNSVVREGEIKMVGDAAPVYEKYKGEFDSVVNGTGRFTPETRKQLVAMLDNAVSNREKSYKQAETTYRGIAEKNGIPVDEVIITPMKRTEQPDDKGAGPKLFDTMPDPAKYKGQRIQSDDGTVYTSDGGRWVRKK